MSQKGSRKERLLIADVRTHCGSQFARLFQTSSSKHDKPVFIWEAGTTVPYSANAIGEGEITADTAAEAIPLFQKHLFEAKVIPNAAFRTGTHLSSILVQFKPKAKDESVCALLQPYGGAHLIRPMAAAALLARQAAEQAAQHVAVAA
ncbi:hypothetical protein [Burkholderia sp. Ac-20365]|uniref:hypothetical protein n=1 Tax=Burkholderia sp. Ac-20365 TaxID=2703897 RepID=UPI00197B2091|nr:hypothetical protein [Burkholderia sp. Ac-20365]MBN3760944.1 hypothetical protein [Burkholderia sp. Ac-20365]